MEKSYKTKESCVYCKQYIHLYSGYILIFEQFISVLSTVIIFTMPQIETAAHYMEEHMTEVLHGIKNPDHMKVEQLRLNTFGNWPPGRKNWPSELANAGFYYIPEKDETKCFVCDITIKGSDWQNNQDVILKHKTANPICPYAQGTYRDHVPFQTKEQREQNKPYLHQKQGPSLQEFLRSGNSGVYESGYPRARPAQPRATGPSGSNRGSLFVDHSGRAGPETQTPGRFEEDSVNVSQSSGRIKEELGRPLE